MNNINKKNPNDYVGIIYDNFVATEAQIKDRKEQIRKCEHKFIELQDGIYECLLCGVTNKFKKVEQQISKSIIVSNLATPETMMYKELFETGGLICKINLMSRIKIDSKHASLLYEIAKFVEPYLPDEEIVKVMYILDKLENADEKNNLASIDDARILITRYRRFLKCNAKEDIIDNPPKIVRTSNNVKKNKK